MLVLSFLLLVSYLLNRLQDVYNDRWSLIYLSATCFLCDKLPSIRIVGCKIGLFKVNCCYIHMLLTVGYKNSLGWNNLSGKCFMSLRKRFRVDGTGRSRETSPARRRVSRSPLRRRSVSPRRQFRFSPRRRSRSPLRRRLDTARNTAMKYGCSFRLILRLLSEH